MARLVKSKNLKKLNASAVNIFKIANRRGYAAICHKNLTEGKSPQEAYARMAKAIRRDGYELAGSAPRSK